MVAAMAAACGGGPAGPSKINGTTTIAGTVNADGAAVTCPVGRPLAPGAAHHAARHSRHSARLSDRS